MAYFLKKQNQSNNTYLAIYESFYSPDSKGTKHRCIKSLGSISKLIDSGIDDPISFYQAKVDDMNREKKETSLNRISESSPIRHLGYFPLKAIMEKLGIKPIIDLFDAYGSNFDFNFSYR